MSTGECTEGKIYYIALFEPIMEQVNDCVTVIRFILYGRKYTVTLKREISNFAIKKQDFYLVERIFQLFIFINLFIFLSITKMDNN